MVDAELDGAAQDGERGVGVAGRAEDAGAGELHRAEADPVDGLVAQAMRSWVMAQACATVGRRTRGASILGLAPPPPRAATELAEFLRHRRERT